MEFLSTGMRERPGNSIPRYSLPSRGRTANYSMDHICCIQKNNLNIALASAESLIQHISIASRDTWWDFMLISNCFMSVRHRFENKAIFFSQIIYNILVSLFTSIVSLNVSQIDDCDIGEYDGPVLQFPYCNTSWIPSKTNFVPKSEKCWTTMLLPSSTFLVFLDNCDWTIQNLGLSWRWTLRLWNFGTWWRNLLPTFSGNNCLCSIQKKQFSNSYVWNIFSS
jgi:hypothetical protein